MQFENTVDYEQPALAHGESVLPVSDVTKTVEYWRDVLGFTNHWLWGDPPNHAGISWDAVSVQLSLNPEHAANSKGHCIWIRVRQLEALYEQHQKKKANIVAPLQHKPWGFAEYIVKEINDHYLVFTAPANERKIVEKPKALVRISERVPTFDEMRNLALSVKWNASNDSSAFTFQLQSTVYSVVAENADTGEAVGCAFLLGDRKSIYYVKDVIVHPEWQRNRIGTQMMQALKQWVDKQVPNRATVGLFCGEQLAPFYGQFGFQQACGMYQVIDRENKS